MVGIISSTPVRRSIVVDVALLFVSTSLLLTVFSLTNLNYQGVYQIGEVQARSCWVGSTGAL